MSIMRSRTRRSVRGPSGAMPGFMDKRSRRLINEEARKAVAVELEKLEGNPPAEKLKWVCAQLHPADRAENHSKCVAYLNMATRLACIPGALLAVQHLDQFELIRSVVGLRASSSCEVRAGMHRLLRYCAVIGVPMALMARCDLDWAIVRSLELDAPHINVEKRQAMHLLRAWLQKDRHTFPRSLVAIVVSLADSDDGYKTAALETLCELALVNNSEVARLGGYAVLVHSLLGLEGRVHVEALVHVLMMLTDSVTRRRTFDPWLYLPKILAPLTSLEYLHRTVVDSDHDADSLAHVAASSYAVTAALHTWPGVFYLFSSPAGAASLVEVLRLGQHRLEVLNSILLILYNIFGLDVPGWLETLRDALASPNPGDGSGRKDDTTAARNMVNLADQHLAILLLAFINAGLHTALVKLITTHTDSRLCVRGTILLAKVTRLATRFLPPQRMLDAEIKSGLEKVANLPESTHTRTVASMRTASRAAVVLRNLDEVHKIEEEENRQGIDFGKQKRMDDATWSLALKGSRVTETKEWSSWDWELIGSLVLVKGNFDKSRVESSSTVKFLKRLVDFFKPRSNQFSKLPSKHTKEIARGLIQILVATPDGFKLLQGSDLVADLVGALERFKGNMAQSPFFNGKSPLSPTYFAILGEIMASTRGLQLLTDAKGIQHLYAMCDGTCAANVIAHFLDAIDPRADGHPRIILQMLLTSSDAATRLVATKRAGALLLCRQRGRRERWHVELIVQQLTDYVPEVAMAALETLAEACDDAETLKLTIDLEPPLVHLGDEGGWLQLRFLGNAHGFKRLRACGFLDVELRNWQNGKLRSYPNMVDKKLLHDLSLFDPPDTRDSDYTYMLTSRVREAAGDCLVGLQVYAPPHLYGELARTSEGIDILRTQNLVSSLSPALEVATDVDPTAKFDVPQTKAALWAIGHVGMSSLGADLLPPNSLEMIAQIASTSLNMSLRGTAVFVLGMLAHNHELKVKLKSVGWSVKRMQTSWSGCVVTPIDSKDFFQVPDTSDDGIFGYPRLTQGKDGEPTDQSDAAIVLPVGPRGEKNGLEGFFQRAVDDTIEMGGREGCEEATKALCIQAIELCVAGSGNHISAGRAKPLLGVMRTELAQYVNTVETYRCVRRCIDRQRTGLTVRRVINTVFTDTAFLREPPRFDGAEHKVQLLRRASNSSTLSADSNSASNRLPDDGATPVVTVSVEGGTESDSGTDYDAGVDEDDDDGDVSAMHESNPFWKGLPLATTVPVIVDDPKLAVANVFNPFATDIVTQTGIHDADNSGVAEAASAPPDVEAAGGDGQKSNTPVDATAIGAEHTVEPNSASVASAPAESTVKWPPQPGDAITLSGLAKKPELNGVLAVVLPKAKWKGERVGIRLATQPFKTLSVDPTKTVALNSLPGSAWMLPPDPLLQFDGYEAELDADLSEARSLAAKEGRPDGDQGEPRRAVAPGLK
eukprot:CAMPEP_0206292348 /NCGR_PEP_ID=MMETSP0106_2-20121207/3581_1 /ASSEMBLY_ACC=CAM_ASM_000206 /TAXON_ID=81532 /ORGANISM="Acanthoeca-like sp., Strain 10tr" /LENGTH=1449 /DNA_ID=CAMNT_0053722921 /DNA_START=202 /DNA_END=4548 /DNA_ORIENTATION=-